MHCLQRLKRSWVFFLETFRSLLQFYSFYFPFIWFSSHIYHGPFIALLIRVVLAQFVEACIGFWMSWSSLYLFIEMGFWNSYHFCDFPTVSLFGLFIFFSIGYGIALRWIEFDHCIVFWVLGILLILGFDWIVLVIKYLFVCLTVIGHCREQNNCH